MVMLTQVVIVLMVGVVVLQQVVDLVRVFFDYLTLFRSHMTVM